LYLRGILQRGGRGKRRREERAEKGEGR